MIKTSIILRLLLIVGLIVSPLTPRIHAATAATVTMADAQLLSAQPSAVADANDAALPCHDGKMDCGKACPCMAACMSLSFQCLPGAVAAVAGALGAKTHFIMSRDAQLASLLTAPPARPPRA